MKFLPSILILLLLCSCATRKSKHSSGLVFAEKIFELINTQGKGADLQALRYMSGQQGADALLLVRGTSVVNSDLNPKALSYLALVPMLFIEGNDVSASFITQAVLWDVWRLRGNGRWSGPLPFGNVTVQWRNQKPSLFRTSTRSLWQRSQA